MELEDVLKYLNTLERHESISRLIIAVEYAIEARQNDRYRINQLEQAIVECFLRDHAK